MANTLAPGSDLRNQIEGHIAALGLIPRNITTNVSVSGNAAGSRFGGPRAHGGPTLAGKFYEVTEGGRSELLQEGGKTYLMAGTNGFVSPLSSGVAPTSGSGDIVIHLTTNVDGEKVDESLTRVKRRNGSLGFLD